MLSFVKLYSQLELQIRAITISKIKKTKEDLNPINFSIRLLKRRKNPDIREVIM
tara:strand:+ start:2251 stop:2412 length:162 start_codon:yes stop_codon:yes gene_type:complete